MMRDAVGVSIMGSRLLKGTRNLGYAMRTPSDLEVNGIAIGFMK